MRKNQSIEIGESKRDCICERIGYESLQARTFYLGSDCEAVGWQPAVAWLLAVAGETLHFRIFAACFVLNNEPISRFQS